LFRGGRVAVALHDTRRLFSGERSVLAIFRGRIRASLIRSRLRPEEWKSEGRGALIRVVPGGIQRRIECRRIRGLRVANRI
jgi:hypothetical protein